MNYGKINPFIGQGFSFLSGRPLLKLFLSNCLVAIAVYVTGWISGTFFKGSGHSLPVIWPAGGVAMVAFLLAGIRVWPGVLLPLIASCWISDEKPIFCLLAPLMTTAAFITAFRLLKAYLPFPFLVWTALSGGLPGASVAILGVIAIASVFTGRDLGPFATSPAITGAWQLEIYIAVISSTGLLLGAGSESQMRERILREEASVRKAEIERVKAQIHPHFLFNCLAAIHSLVATDPAAARSGITSLSSLLRNSLDAARENRIPLGKEIQIIRDSLILQKMRFEEGLETDIEVGVGAEAFPVAPMIIQPLVENAVKHGVVDGKGCVKVTASVNGEWLNVTITNTAPPVNKPSLWKEGVGLVSVRARLLDTWGDRAELSYAAISTGTVTTALRIPRS